MPKPRKGGTRPCASPSVDGAAEPNSTARRKAGNYVPSDLGPPARSYRYHGPMGSLRSLDDFCLIDDLFEGGDR